MCRCQEVRQLPTRGKGRIKKDEWKGTKYMAWKWKGDSGRKVVSLRMGNKEMAEGINMGKGQPKVNMYEIVLQKPAS